MREHRVRSLLMGGQACVFYGAAEFSRNTDFVILADSANLQRFRQALDVLRAERIAVPPFKSKYLQRRHAIHFRCQHPEAFRMRVDVMSKMRGVDSFAKLWRRRTTIELVDHTLCDLMSLPDLVRHKPNAAQTKFWLLELRTPALLVDLAQTNPRLLKKLLPMRRLLKYAAAGQMAPLERALSAEEAIERKKDKLYWAPLLRELEKLRHPGH